MHDKGFSEHHFEKVVKLRYYNFEMSKLLHILCVVNLIAISYLVVTIFDKILHST